MLERGIAKEETILQNPDCTRSRIPAGVVSLITDILIMPVFDEFLDPDTQLPA